MDNNTLYDYNNLNDFYNNIDNLINQVNKKKLLESDPTITEINNVQSIIYDYIKTNKKKIYGGVALKLLLEEKNATEQIYEDYEFPDIDFYSWDPINDLIKLCNLLHEKNFKYVRGREAMHKESYTIYVNNKQYLNITYVPKNIYNKIPFKEINNLHIVHPHFLMIDYLRIFTDPIVSYWRLKDKKTFDRYYLLQKYFPLPYTNNQLNIDSRTNEQKLLLNKILNFTKDKETLIHIGLFAYNYFAKQINNQVINNVPYYEIISTDYKKDCLDLINSLDCDKTKLTIEENFPFFQYFGYNMTIIYDGKILCKIYDNNNRCIPFKTNENYLIGTFNIIILNNLITLMKARIDNNQELKNQVYIIISNLIQMKKQYLTKTKKSIFDDSPFQDFSLEYKGKTLPPEKERQLIGELRKKRNKPFLFAYDPSTKSESEPINYIFLNSSGNIINNAKKSKLFNTNLEEEDDIL